MSRLRPWLLASVLALTACGGAADQPADSERGDPAIEAAVNGPLAADPDLAAQNGANAAASLPSASGAVPSLDAGTEAIDRARNDAVALVGGSAAMRQAPAPQTVDQPLPPEAALGVAARAASTPGMRDCAGKAEYTAAWAAKMPPAFPVYPRAAVQEAAGSDRGGCALRAVTFRTPVPLNEVMDFYFTQAGKAGFATRHVLQDGNDVLSGTKGRASFAVYARKLASGVTEADLVTSK
jgi:hypothetical protein